MAGSGRAIPELLRDGDEIFPGDRLRLEPLRLRADLRAFDRAFRRLAVVVVVEFVDQLLVELIAIRFVAPGFHDPVHNIEPETGVAKAGFFVEQRLGRHAGDVSLLADRRLQIGERNFQDFVGLADAIVGVRRRRGEKEHRKEHHNGGYCRPRIS